LPPAFDLLGAQKSNFQLFQIPACQIDECQ
jgi:hypothetical protein